MSFSIQEQHFTLKTEKKTKKQNLKQYNQIIPFAFSSWVTGALSTK